MFDKFLRRFITFHIIKLRNFSIYPGGRTRKDGEFSAEEFRDNIVIPSFKKYKYIAIDLDGTRGIGSNFLEEVFGGLIRKGFKYEDIKRYIKIKSIRPSILEEVERYLKGEDAPAAKTLKMADPVRHPESKKQIENSTNFITNTEWVSLGVIQRPEKKIFGYVCSHETRCNGEIVAFVPFRKTDLDKIEVLVRFEATPCWDFDRPVPSSFTGGVQYGLHPEECVLTELDEEAGYEAELDRIISLGQCYGTKSTDTIYHLYGVDLTGLEQTNELTCETELEKTSFNKWIPINETKFLVPDPMFGMIIFRLNHIF